MESTVPYVKKPRLATTSEVSKLPVPSEVLAMFGDKQGVCCLCGGWGEIGEEVSLSMAVPCT